ncbi:restriction endonuclease subunit S [Acinetobacter baumannii]|uniref:restriction endonuclease subunit S n=1 Tax=Acinetobacter baumannii TaxID=470 RepID=UPI00234262A9|nr:restriction endonuclease subunit S [Acinetobacter baumannii]
MSALQQWTPTTLGELLIFTGGSQPPLSVFSKIEHEGYIRLIQIRDYKTDKYTTYIPKDLARRFCDANDIMIGRYGPPIFQILRGLEGAYNVALIKVTPKGNILKDFAWHYLRNDRLFKHIDKLSRRTSGQTGVDLNELENYPIQLPPLAEQQKIAQALTDADDYISALEKLIEKKKMIKEGLLSELFKKESEWNAYAIEDLVLPNNGLVRGPFGGALKKEDFVNEGYKVYEQKNAIYKNSELGTYYINKNKYRKLIRFAVRSDDLILSCSGTIGKIYRIPSNFEKGVINQALLIIRINQTIIDLDYFEHYFNRQDFQTSIIDDTQGGAMKNLVGMPIFKKKIIYCPDMNKQKEISKILNNLDLDIDSIDKKLDKAKKLKQGMMQKLLTGEIRLA